MLQIGDLISFCWVLIPFLCYLGSVAEFFHTTVISVFLQIKFNWFIWFPFLLRQGSHTVIDSRDQNMTCGIHKAVYKIRCKYQYKWSLFLPLGNHNTFSLLPSSLPTYLPITTVKLGCLIWYTCIFIKKTIELLFVCSVWCVCPASDMKTSSYWDTNQH